MDLSILCTTSASIAEHGPAGQILLQELPVPLRRPQAGSRSLAASTACSRPGGSIWLWRFRLVTTSISLLCPPAQRTGTGTPRPAQPTCGHGRTSRHCPSSNPAISPVLASANASLLPDEGLGRA